MEGQFDPEVECFTSNSRQDLRKRPNVIIICLVPWVIVAEDYPLGGDASRKPDYVFQRLLAVLVQGPQKIRAEKEPGSAFALSSAGAGLSRYFKY